MKKPRRLRAVRESGAPIAASRFKAQCLQLMDYVKETGLEVVITKHGQPVAKLVPVRPRIEGDGYGILKGTVTYHGDIVAPTGDRWDAAED